MPVSKLKESVLMGFHQLTLNKFRASLAVVGISIGIAALVSVESIGEGTKMRLIQQMEELGGAEVLVLEIQPDKKHGKATEFEKQDIDILARNLTRVEALAPRAYAGPTVVQRDDGFKVHSAIYGVTSDFYRVRNLELQHGRFIWDRDEINLNKVCVLASQIGKRLFGNTNPVGRSVRLEDDIYFVVGILKDAKFYDLQYGVFVPLATVKKLMGPRVRTRQIYIKISSVDAIEVMKARLERLFSKLWAGRNILIKDRLLAIQTVKKSSRLLQLFLLGIGCITLVVGGFGIMNVMLVSVTERTTEIGIRKAVGAKSSDILHQFLIETIILSLPGALLGLAGGYFIAVGIAGLISRYLKMTITSEFSVVTVIVAVAFSLGVGFTFGLFPAMQAARKNVINALGYE
jgi:putative ABC transport system permease protein